MYNIVHVRGGIAVLGGEKCPSYYILESSETTACLRNAAGATTMGAAEGVCVCEVEELARVAPLAEMEDVKTFPHPQTGQGAPLSWNFPPVPDPHNSL